MIALRPQPRILVVALRRIGDVLLTTPLVRSLRRAGRTPASSCWCFADTPASCAAIPTSIT